jgi:hypothetical protein
LTVQSKIVLSFFICCSLALPTCGQVTSVLSSGDWHKFSLENDGVYKIDYELLRKTGINPDQIDPRNIQIFSGGNGMLPQPNNKARIIDLVQLSLFVSGEADGKFDRGDFILFFGQGPDKYGYNQQKQIFEYENHLYADKNFYFLSVGATPGKRITNQATVDGSFPIVREFEDFAYYETEKYNLLKSGRQWFGEQFDNSPEAVIRFDIAGIIDNSPIKIASHVMAQSISDCTFKVFFNNTPILDQPVPAIPNTQYGIKGRITKDTISINSSFVKAAAQNTQEVKYQFTRGSTAGLSVGYLDFFLFTMKRKLALYGDQTIFTSSKSLDNTVSTFEVTSVNPKTIVWDITDPFNTVLQSLTLSGTSLLTTAPTSSLKKFIAFDSEKTKSPTFEITIKNQNLHAVDNKSLIIVTHPTFRSEAERLANHRQSKNGLSTLVVTTDQVYHEYSGGKQDVTAIRDFVRDVYRKAGSSLKNVLLFGRGSYDYKSRVASNTNFVPIYESLNSLSPLETYSSDDYFGMLEDNEGAWLESPAQNSTMDVGIGRIPVKKIEEAKAVVDKLIEYETNPKAKGVWRKEILFVADDADFNIHQSQADQMANSIDVSNPELNIKKLYLDSFDQIQRNTGPASPAATRALDLDIRKGKSIVNYTGHGSEKVWMQEQVLTETIVLNWKNSPEYPLFVTATCEFGRNDDPFIISSGERILLQPKGGGIGLVTTARPVNSSTNFTLNRAFYTALFLKENNKYRDLGSIFRDTKNTSISGVSNRNFSLLGDPSMTIGFSNKEVVLDEIKTTTGSLTLKGLSQVKAKGQLKEGGTKLTNFNGEVFVKLYDKPTVEITKGSEGTSPFTYSQWENVLFSGRVSATNGNFEVSFVMPRNVNAISSTGKLSLYATSSNQDAFGYSSNFQVGGLEPSPTPDTTPPEITLFLGDTTYVAGGVVGPNTNLVARLFDESGLNTTSFIPTNNMVALLDNQYRFVVNDYYISEKDNYKKGLLIYPLDTLKKGRHSLSLTVSDTYNNTSTKIIEFVVSDGNQIQISEFYNFPNPVTESTRFRFTHSRPGEDLLATIVIYNSQGQIVHSQEHEVKESQYQVTLDEWTGENPDGRKLSNGLYIARLFVRSVTDGSNNELASRLIIMN